MWVWILLAFLGGGIVVGVVAIVITRILAPAATTAVAVKTFFDVYNNR